MPIWQIILLASALVFALISIFLWIWNILRAKKLRTEGFVNKKTITKKIKIPFKLDKFISALGGIDNIANTSVVDTKIKIEILSYEKVNFNRLKKINNTGIVVQSDNITIVLGDYANKVSIMVNDMINLHNVSLTTIKSSEIV
ncbi:MAG: hypothetical protein REH79_01165 [Spiroplasma sp.]|nr:hypothetical protein [Spiroplasma sp.]